MTLERIEYPGLEGFAVRPTDRDARVLVRIVDEPAPPSDEAAVDGRWAELCRENPRYFDGPILAMVSAEFLADEGVTAILARRAGYKRLAVQNPGPGFVETRTEQLSVTAVVTGASRDGREHVLLGRRGLSTRIYGGMWELGPSGGVEPPSRGFDLLEDADLARQVMSEIDEELSGRVRVRVGSMVCLTHDPVARSCDLVYRCEAVGPVEGPSPGAANWEYAESSWIAIDEIGAFEHAHASSIIGPTRALFRWFGWV